MAVNGLREPHDVERVQRHEHHGACHNRRNEIVELQKEQQVGGN